MVPIITGILIIVAIAIIAISGLPNTLKPEMQPIRQLVMENFAPDSAMSTNASESSQQEAEYLDEVNFLFDAKTFFVHNDYIKTTLIDYLTNKNNYSAERFLNNMWNNVFLKLEPQFKSKFPNSKTPFRRFFYDFINEAADQLEKADIDPTVKPRINELKTTLTTWAPPASPVPASNASVLAKADISPINITAEAKSRLSTVMTLIDTKGFQALQAKHMIDNAYKADQYIDDAWKIFSAASDKYDKEYPKSTTALEQVFAAQMVSDGNFLKTERDSPQAAKGDALLNAIKLWRPPTKPAPSLPKAAPASNLDSTPAPAPKPTPPSTNGGTSKIIGNQFSLATITLPVTTSINGNTLSIMTASPASKGAAPLPANMVETGAAPKITGGEMDKMVIRLVKDSLRAELKNLGKADKVAITQRSTPGLAQGTDFKKKELPDYKGSLINPNAASFDGGYNHLGPLGDYQDSFHPPLMPDGGYYDPRVYVRKDSIPCYGCSLDY